MNRACPYPGALGYGCPVNQTQARTFVGIMIGLGSVAAVALKAWWMVSDTAPAFWMWAIPLSLIAVGLVVWWRRRREQSSIADRIRRMDHDSPRHHDDG